MLALFKGLSQCAGSLLTMQTWRYFTSKYGCKYSSCWPIRKLIWTYSIWCTESCCSRKTKSYYWNERMGSMFNSVLWNLNPVPNLSTTNCINNFIFKNKGWNSRVFHIIFYLQNPKYVHFLSLRVHLHKNKPSDLRRILLSFISLFLFSVLSDLFSLLIKGNCFEQKSSKNLYI